MSDPPRIADTIDATAEGSHAGSTTGMARWQRVVGIIGLAVVLGLGVLMFGPGGGGQGPGGEAPPAGGHAPPAGGHG